MRKRVVAVVFAGASLVAACSPSPAMRAAKSGDRTALARAIEAHQRAGDLSNARAAALAFAVADRDLRDADDAHSLDRVLDARPCAHELDSALAYRMAHHDASGAAAAIARLDALSLDTGDLRPFVSDGDPRWRAAGVRSLVRGGDRDDRLRALTDPEPLVRRQAARAAREAADPSDLAALAQAARLDPEPLVRMEAVRAIAAMPSPPAVLARAAVDALRDVWTAADMGLREDIASAWAAPALWAAGGREALQALVASQHGHPAIEGAAAILGRHAGDPVAQEAIAQLARAVEMGPRGTRLQAIAQAPLRAELHAPLERAAADDDLEVRVAALAQLARMGDSRVIPDLEALAQPGAPSSTEARLALAALRDRRIQAWLEEDLTAPDAEVRLRAASALAELGVAARGAPLLADPEPSVRVRTACSMLLAARFGR